jgi:hypothetical protein
MDRDDLREKLIILGISVGVFLPIRIVFTSFVSESWLGSIGIMSGLAILLAVLIKKRKLGILGEMFERQMRKTIGGRAGKYIIALSIFFLLYFGATLYFIERGNSMYAEDTEIFFLSIINENGYNFEDFSTYQLIGPKIIENTESKNLQSIANIDYIFSITYAVMNEMSEGWLSHFVIVMFVEQIELIGLLIFFRKTFKQVPQISNNLRQE